MRPSRDKEGFAAVIEGPLREGGAEGQYVGGQGDRGAVSRAGAALEGVGEEWKEEVC